MKRTQTRRSTKLQLLISWSSSNNVEWVAKLEKVLRKKPRIVQIDIAGAGEISPDTALLIRSALLQRCPKTRIIMNARSTLQNGSVLIWLLGDTRIIREDARIFFRPADLPEDAEVDPNEDWKGYACKYHDSVCEVDPEEGDYARVLQLINEFLPVKEFAGRLIGVSVLKQFGLIESDGVDSFLTVAFSKSTPDLAFR